MKRAVRIVLLLCGAMLCSGCGEPPVPRHVFLITIDTLRADHLSAYGYEKNTSPNIDALAAEGTVFESASTTIPLTGPAHSGMMTGRYPLVTGFRNNGTAVLAPEETTLAEILEQKGFRTAGIVSCLVLSSHFGFAQGFDLFYEDDITSEKGQGMWFEERKADKTVDRALRWLESEKTRPVFMWMHLFDPHHPYDPPGVDMSLSMPERYDAEIRFVDEQLGRFFDELKRLGLWDDALIVIAGDHGESLMEHQERFHGVFVYQATMHVPLIVRLPGAGGGRRVADQTSVLDIFPTILDALKLEPPDTELQGLSLVPAVTGQGRVPARSPYLESIYGTASFGWAEVRALRTPRWKYVDLPSPELYDLENDPTEDNNLVVTEPARAEEVRAELLGKVGQLESVKRTDVQTATLDDEMRERLLSLGYIAGNESTMRQGEPRDPKEVVQTVSEILKAKSLKAPGQVDQAETMLKGVLEVDPENKMALMSYGRLLARTKRVNEAVETMEQALEIYPDSEETYRVLGWILIKNDRRDEAIALFSRGLETMPSSGTILYMFGFANFRADRWETAMEALQESLVLSPNVAKAYYLIAVCQEKLGRRDDAYGSFETYLSMEPDVESLFRDPYLEDFRKDARFPGLVKAYL